MTSDTQLPDDAAVDDASSASQNDADTIYAWNYERERDQLVTLYNKGVVVAVERRHRPRLVDRRRPRGAGAPSQDRPTDASLVRTAAELPGSPLAIVGRARVHRARRSRCSRRR